MSATVLSGRPHGQSMRRTRPHGLCPPYVTALISFAHRQETSMKHHSRSNPKPPVEHARTSPLPTPASCVRPSGRPWPFRELKVPSPFSMAPRDAPPICGAISSATFASPWTSPRLRSGEKHAVYGGGPNLKQGIKNVIKKYHPRVIGIASTCLTETIGDDVPMIVNELRKDSGSRTGKLRSAGPGDRVHAKLCGHPHGRFPCCGARHGGRSHAAGRRPPGR